MGRFYAIENGYFLLSRILSGYYLESEAENSDRTDLYNGHLCINEQFLPILSVKCAENKENDLFRANFQQLNYYTQPPVSVIFHLDLHPNFLANLEAYWSNSASIRFITSSIRRTIA